MSSLPQIACRCHPPGQEVKQIKEGVCLAAEIIFIPDDGLILESLAPWKHTGGYNLESYPPS